MGIFGLESTQQRAGNEVEEPDHGTLHEYDGHLIKTRRTIQDEPDSKVM